MNRADWSLFLDFCSSKESENELCLGRLSEQIIVLSLRTEITKERKADPTELEMSLIKTSNGHFNFLFSLVKFRICFLVLKLSIIVCLGN